MRKLNLIVVFNQNLEKRVRERNSKEIIKFLKDNIKPIMVTIAEWTHLYPSRTQKLSTQTPKIVISKNRKLLFFCFKIPFFIVIYNIISYNYLRGSLGII